MSHETTVREGGRDYGAFIPSNLDDYGLDPYEFRVYCRLERRIGKGELGCIESVSNMAKACKMSDQKVKDALRLLVLANIARQEKYPGKPDRYVLMSSKYWVPSIALDNLRKQVKSYRQKSDAKTRAKYTGLRGSSLPDYDVADTGLRGSSLPDYDVADTGLRGSYKGTDLSFSIEGTPSKEGHPPSPVPPPSPTQECVCEDAQTPESQESKQTLPASPTKEEINLSPTHELPPLDREKPRPTLPLTGDLLPRTKDVHPTEKCDRLFDPIPGWRNSKRRNDYKVLFCDYLKAHYLPSVAPWRDGTPPTTGDTKNWIARREYDEKGLSEIENKWSDYQEWQAQEAKKDRELAEANIPTDQDAFLALMRAPDFLERTHPRYQRRAG